MGGQPVKFKMTVLRMPHREFMIAMDCIESGGLAEVWAWTQEDQNPKWWLIEPIPASIEGMRESFQRIKFS